MAKTEKIVTSPVLNQYGQEIKDYIDRGDSNLADSISSTDERVADLDQRLTDDINNFEVRIEKTERKNEDQDLEILELKHLIYETVVDHVEATIEDVDVKPIPDYVDQHKVIDGGEIMLSEILGKTEKWNQLVDAMSIEDNFQWESESVVLSNGKATFTFGGNESARIFINAPLRNPIKIVSTHKYVFIPDISITNITLGKNVLTLRFRKTNNEFVSVGDFNYDSKGFIFNFQDSVINRIDIYQASTTNSITTNSKLEYAPHIVDLTDIFGTGNEPTDVNSPEVQKLIAKAKAHPEYDAGSLHSVMAENFKVNGANIWDEQWENRFIDSGLLNQNYISSKNFIPAFPNTRYYFAFVGTGYSNKTMAIYGYDENKENKTLIKYVNDANGWDFTTDANTKYIKFGSIVTGAVTTYNHDIAIVQGTSGTYKPHKAPFVLNFLQGNQLKTTETKTLGTLTMTVDRGKLTLSGMSMATRVATIGDTLLKAGTYSYRIENPSGDNVGLYDITGDDWLFASSRPVLQGTFTLATDKTIAMGLDARVGVNYGGREIRYMVAKGSETLNEFKQGGITEPIELNGVGDVHGRLIIEQQASDMTFNLVLERATGKIDLGTFDWSIGYSLFRTYLSGIKRPASSAIKANIVCSNYTTKDYNHVYSRLENKIVGIPYDENRIYINDTTYTNVNDFKQAMSGVMLVYELATPTRETLITGLTESQVAALLEKGGTIEIGNETMTLPDVKVWLDVRKLEA